MVEHCCGGMPKAAVSRGFLVSIQASIPAKFICGPGPFAVLRGLQNQTRVPQTSRIPWIVRAYPVFGPPPIAKDRPKRSPCRSISRSKRERLARERLAKERLAKERPI